MTDWRYVTLKEVNGWMLDIDPSSPLPNDDEMSMAIARAETIWDSLAGSRFDQQSYTLVQPLTVFVDGNNWLHLTAYESGPVTAVSAIQVMNTGAGESTWRVLNLPASTILLPPVTTPPKPSAWEVRLRPAPSLSSAATGMIEALWTYTAGYATIPPALKAEICRLTVWVWKLTREAPLGIVKNPMLGLVDIPLSVPPDIKADALLWSRGSS